jgi:hypothetical protein
MSSDDIKARKSIRQESILRIYIHADLVAYKLGDDQLACEASEGTRHEERHTQRYDTSTETRTRVPIEEIKLNSIHMCSLGRASSENIPVGERSIAKGARHQESRNQRWTLEREVADQYKYRK